MSRHSIVSKTSSMLIDFAFRIILLALVVYALLLSVRYAYSVGHGLMYEYAVDAAPGIDAVIEIRKGDSRKAVAERLADAHLIENKESFILKSILYESHLEPGSYTLNSSMTIGQMLEFIDEEGLKLRELKEKNLVDETAPAAQTPETDANGAEVIGGDEDVDDAAGNPGKHETEKPAEDETAAPEERSAA